MAPELTTLLPQLPDQLAHTTRLVLEAPPGSGKTTRVPLALLDADWLQGQKILLLEPRRLAARAAARYMARQLGEKLGKTVGYRVRNDQQVSAQTRLEVVTEGILTRMLQSDPALEGVGLIIFDEFHERSLQGDLGLSLCLEVQQALREDLRLLVMSATLDTPRLTTFLQAPLVQASGQAFEIQMHYAPQPANTPWLKHLKQQILAALQQYSGSLLVFLPGAGEIRQLERQLTESLPAEVLLAPLYGQLPGPAQDQAIAPAPAGQRKVVLATNVAETSLTIEGISVVIDSGLARSPRFDPVSGMSQLITGQISKASATQRAGRAGRLGPGVCIRLWHEADQARLQSETPAEILGADLAPLALELALWGSSDPAQLQWLDAPPAAPYAQALSLLQDLGALDAEGRITPLGKALSRLPLHPRLGHMLLQAMQQGLGGLACSLAALLEARDLLNNSPEVDLQLRLDLLSGRRKGALPARREEVLQAAQQLGELLKVKPAYGPPEAVAEVLALAYPERLAQRRPGQQNGPVRFLLANGRGAVLPEGDPLGQSPWLAVAQLDGNPREARVFLAAALDSSALERISKGHCQWRKQISYNTQTGSVQALQQLHYGALILKSQPLKDLSPEDWAAALCDGLRQQGLPGLKQLPWTPALEQLRARAQFVALNQATQDDNAWPALDDDSLLAELEDWLQPFIGGLKKLTQIQSEQLQQGLEYRIGYSRLQSLQSLAPSHWPVPSGSRIRLAYQGTEVVLAARLQELFGLEDTPRILAGEVPVTIHLLSPARRPVQVTRDLRSFWRETYPEVKKELKGRYPKHYWPEDPLQAEAISGTKKQNRIRD
ncbi:MAG: ATP-dependent helicase HrpB [Candidatus Sericytochromatia bacterium]|nr:ATP-dependent helicase HrpB [Candidatus Sericytochromatia bacterium]